MALPSFILAPASNELEKCPMPGNNEASRQRKGENVVPHLLCPGEGRGGGQDAPSQLGHMSQCLKGRGRKHFVIV